MSNLISYYFPSIANAKRMNFFRATIKSNTLLLKITKILYQEGYIAGYDIDRGYINVYPSRGVDYTSFELVSTSGRRVYMTFNQIKKEYTFSDFVIFSTHRGLMTIFDIYAEGIGGEILIRKKRKP